MYDGNENGGNSRKFKFEKITRGGSTEEEETVAVERSYDMVINGGPLTTIRASPSDIEELAYGFLVSEGIIEGKDQIDGVEIEGGEIHVETVSDIEKIEKLELRSSGSRGIRKKGEKEIHIESPIRISPEFVFGALKHLETELYRRTSGSHSATLIDRRGEVLAIGVDVSRHNSYDKVIGKTLLQDIEASKSILLASGRQSEAMVMKAARMGIPITISKAAPLSSGIEAAERTNMTLICFANEEKFNVYAGKERIEI